MPLAVLILLCFRYLLVLHSFPTRRSSDLGCVADRAMGMIWQALISKAVMLFMMQSNAVALMTSLLWGQMAVVIQRPYTSCLRHAEMVNPSPPILTLQRALK